MSLIESSLLDGCCKKRSLNRKLMIYLIIYGWRVLSVMVLLSFPLKHPMYLNVQIISELNLVTLSFRHHGLFGVVFVYWLFCWVFGVFFKVFSVMDVLYSSPSWYLVREHCWEDSICEELRCARYGIGHLMLMVYAQI